MYPLCLFHSQVKCMLSVPVNSACWKYEISVGLHAGRICELCAKWHCEYCATYAEVKHSFGGSYIWIQLFMVAWIVDWWIGRSLLNIVFHSLLQLWCQFTSERYILWIFSFNVLLYLNICYGLHFSHLWNRAGYSAHSDRGNISGRWIACLVQEMGVGPVHA